MSIAVFALGNRLGIPEEKTLVAPEFTCGIVFRASTAATSQCSTLSADRIASSIRVTRMEEP